MVEILMEKEKKLGNKKDSVLNAIINIIKEYNNIFFKMNIFIE